MIKTGLHSFNIMNISSAKVCHSTISCIVGLRQNSGRAKFCLKPENTIEERQNMLIKEQTTNFGEKDMNEICNENR